MDLSRAMSEVRSLPDEALKKELAQPTGMLPGYLILGEMTERQALRNGGGRPQRMSIAQEMLRGYQSPPAEKSYADGGLVAATNPFLAYIEAMQNPEQLASLKQEQINSRAAGLPGLMPLRALEQAGPPVGLDWLKPWQPGTLQTPNSVGAPEKMPNWEGGIDKLLRR